MKWAVKCLAWSWFVAWLWPIQQLPLANFYNEYAAAIGLIGAVACLCWRGRRPAWPAVATVVLPLLLMGLVQLTRVDLDFTTVLWVLVYLALFIVAAWVGMQLRDQPDALPLLAQAIAAAALVSAVFTVIQLTSWQTQFFPWVRDVRFQAGMRPFANLGQPNHLSLLLMLGVASAAYLWTCGRWRGWATVMAVGIMTIGLALAHTRAAVGMALVLVGWAALYSGPQRRRLLVWSCGLVGVLLLALTVITPSLMDYWGLPWRSAPLLPGQADARVQTWLASWKIIRLAPWWGVGLGHYSLGFFEVAPQGFGVLGPTDHAHQLFLQWAVDAGVPVAVCSAVLLGRWWWRQLRHLNSLPQQFALACVSMMAVHNLVEFPWWSLYFLVPTGVLAGYLERRPERAEGSTAKPNLYGLVLCALAALAAVRLTVEYRQMATDFESVVVVRNASAVKAKAEVSAVLTWSPFLPFERYMRFVSTPITPDNAAQQMAEGHWLIRRFPHPFGLMHYLHAAVEAQAWAEVRLVLKTQHAMAPKTYFRAMQALRERCAMLPAPQSAVYCTAANPDL